ncbi:MAG: hypothetical protein FJX25_07240 [Alphaproteobacteria bacterium]|nr:hypothetical protein [Alphaproteobacteria bacterium]
MTFNRAVPLALPLSLLALCATAQPAQQPVAPAPGAVTSDLPPGLRAARLLPGWTDAAGNRVLALDLRLEPGWKTYWRSPGDTGLPPYFEWDGSQNLAGVTFHWPAPEAIRSGERLEMGYHDRLVLPFTAHPADPGQPVIVASQVELGLCENICVPVRLDLLAPDPAAGTDPQITAALEAVPERLDGRPTCKVSQIPDGLRVTVGLPGPDTTLAAVELTDQPEVWVSGADLVQDGQGPEAVVEMVGPSGRPFPLDPDSLRLTVLSGQGVASRAVEMMGCDLTG